MRSETRLHRWSDHLARRLGGERGIVIVVVMMFCLVFLIVGLALYWLTTSQIRATETERRDVRSFNVAEAGVDAGMLALKLDWPSSNADYVTVADDLIKTALVTENPTLGDPTNPGSSPSEFLQVSVYDNSVYDDNLGHYVRVTEPPAELADRVMWDAVLPEDIEGWGDGKMFVEATSNVEDARHRILLLAECQPWYLKFPVGTALRSAVLDSNGLGLGIQIEDGVPPVYYDVNDTEGKGIDEGVGVDPWPNDPIAFDEIITETLINALLGIAQQRGTYYEDDAEGSADTKAEAFLTSGNAGGSVVYVKSANAVDIASSVQIGSEEFPTVVILDTPDGTENSWDMTGTADLYGILVVLGNSTLKGTCSIHGAIFTEGTLLNKGVGSVAELLYNQTVIKNINRQYILSVHIVPNTWEEYTTPKEVSE